MTTDLETMIANAGLPALMTAAGQTVTYEGESITAVVGPADSRRDYEDDDKYAVERREIIVAASDVASPAVGDPVSIGTKEYKVAEVLGSDGAGSRLTIAREARSRIGTPGATISRST